MDSSPRFAHDVLRSLRRCVPRVLLRGPVPALRSRLRLQPRWIGFLRCEILGQHLPGAVNEGRDLALVDQSSRKEDGSQSTGRRPDVFLRTVLVKGKKRLQGLLNLLGELVGKLPEGLLAICFQILYRCVCDRVNPLS